MNGSKTHETESICDRCGGKLEQQEIVHAPRVFSREKTNTYCKSCAAEIVKREKSYPLFSGAGGLLIITLGLAVISSALNLPVLARTLIVCLCLPGGFAFLWMGFEMRRRVNVIRKRILKQVTG